MFGFGSKFKATSLQSFGKTVADYLHSSGEACLIANPVEDIPLKHEISNKNSESRFIFDLGVMYGLAYINLRDQEQKELKYLNEFIKEGLTYVSKYGFNLEHGPKETDDRPFVAHRQIAADQIPEQIPVLREIADLLDHTELLVRRVDQNRNSCRLHAGSLHHRIAS